MMKNVLIIGCGLIGSSLLRAIANKKLAKKIFVYEKSKKNIKSIKSLKLPCEIVYDLNNIIPKLDSNLLSVKEILELIPGTKD